MSLRFRKSMKIAPGVRMNFSKSGVGFSVGTKGARVSVSPKGKVTRTIGIPGTGIYDVKTISTNSETTVKPNRQQSTAAKPKIPFYKTSWFNILMLIFILPVGVITMWAYTEWPEKVKIIITAIFLLAVALYVLQ